MKFTLKDYQDDAVADVLKRLKKGRKDWHDDASKVAFPLTATTGAGKTVMASAVFEALFYGSDDYNFEADPGAVVIWFSDDPSLNEQSRWRLHEASDKLTVSDLITVESSFGREKFEPGKVYFLNTQKLSKNSLLVRGHDADHASIEKDGVGARLMPDLRSHTIWDTIQNTIEDPELTLYLVLDEAHRGMKESGPAATTGKQNHRQAAHQRHGRGSRHSHCVGHLRNRAEIQRCCGRDAGAWNAAQCGGRFKEGAGFWPYQGYDQSRRAG